MKIRIKKILGIGLAVVMAAVASAGINDLPVKTINGRQYHYYEVQPQETVYSLCRRFDITKEELVRWNPSVADGLRARQQLIFPKENSESVVKDYVVKKGETGYAISHRFGMTVDEFYALNPSMRDGLKAGATVKVRVTAPAESENSRKTEPVRTDSNKEAVASSSSSTYVIRPHDTLYKIAGANGLTLAELLAANPGLDVNNYKAGTTINIPAAKSGATLSAGAQGNTYIVKEGDTFYSIARAHALSPEHLRAANPSVDVLRPGMVIDIPQACGEELQAPVTSAGVAEAERADSILIAIALPFNASAAQRDARSQRAVEFLRGFTVALDSMRNTGLPVKLMVYDTKGTDEGVNEILADPMLKTAQVIIAPDVAGHLDKFAGFARENKIYLLNLFVIKDETYRTNPYMMNSNIPHEAMYGKAVEYFVSKFPDMVPVILKRDDGKTDKAEFTNLLQEALGKAGRKYHIINYSDKLSASTLMNLAPGVDYAFIPVSSTIDELHKFIDGVCKYKETRDDGGDVMLWGFAEWLTARGDNETKLHDANTYIFSRFYSVEKDDEEEALQNRFEKWFGTRILDRVPKQGTYGFDTGMYLIKALNANNGDFSRPTPAYDGIQNAFDFIGVDNGGWVNNEMFMIHFAPANVTLKNGI